MTTPTIDHLVCSDPTVLGIMGFDVVRLRTLRRRARSHGRQLEQLGFDVDHLEFYRWLAKHGPDPEMDCSVSHRRRAHAR